MSPVVLTALFLTVWEIAGRRLPALPSGPWPRVSRPATALAALALVGAFVGQLLLTAYQAGHDGSPPAWVSRTPYLFVDEAFPFGDAHAAIMAAAFGLALIQTAALAALVGALSQVAGDPERAAAGRLAWLLVPFLGGVLAILALWSPAVSSGDVFGYVGLGMLGAHPFARPPHFFSGEYARVFDAWHLRPTIYGPLWTALNAVVVSFGGSFAGKVLALRIFGALLLTAFAGLAFALTRSRAVTAAVALNPMLWFQFATNAHNDAYGICLLAAALLLVRGGRTAWAVVLVAAAGCVKFPFVVLGAVLFAREGPRRAILCAAAAAALCCAASALFAGQPYLDALLSTARTRAAFTDPLLNVMKTALSLATLGVTAFILLRGRFPRFAGWLYTGLAPVLFPWYLAWAVVYAFAARTLLVGTLLALPVLATLSDGIYHFDTPALIVPVVALAWVARGLRSEPHLAAPVAR